MIATRELENPLYVDNPPNRCYFCKAELFSRMNALAAERGFAAIAYGENADDPGGFATWIACRRANSPSWRLSSRLV